MFALQSYGLVSCCSHPRRLPRRGAQGQMSSLFWQHWAFVVGPECAGGVPRPCSSPAHSSCRSETAPRASQVVELPALVHEGRAEQRVYLLVGPADGTGRPPATRLLPDSPAARAHLRSPGRALRFWRANLTTGALELH